MRGADAIHQYEDLKRELTNLSRKLTTEGKVEEGAPDTFDLTEFLHGVSQERGSAGLKDKRLGLIWKNLTVKVTHIWIFYIRQLPTRTHRAIISAY